MSLAILAVLRTALVALLLLALGVQWLDQAGAIWAPRPAHVIPAEIGTSSGTHGQTPAPRWSSVERKPEPAGGPKGDVPGSDPAGWATWYRAAGYTAAAGPVLRRLLGRDWRGSVVVVESGGRSVTVTLSDWCACQARHGRPTLLDLSDAAFGELAPLAVGVVAVRVRTILPPATDTP